MFDHLTVVIARADVEKGDVEPTLIVLRRLLESAENTKLYRERLEVTCHGYDSDPRELWEIPEVRTFVSRMDREFPFGCTS